MTAPLKIAVVTGSRAEYGLLRPVVAALVEDAAFSPDWIVTGSHLAPEHGFTVDEIAEDALAPIKRLPILVAGDDGAAAAKAMGLAQIGLADLLAQDEPHALLVLGDRYEILAAVAAAAVTRIPIIHLGGGEVTEGAFDDALRHAITKMAHLHFALTDDAARRIRQMGEDSGAVHVVGHPGLDDLAELPAPDRAVTEQALGFSFRARNVLVTYHPETLGERDPETDLGEMLDALAALGDDVGILFTAPNADPAGMRLAALIEAFVRGHDNAALYASLGRRRYLDVLRQMDAVLGNSSSGLLEAPSLKVPTVNIGTRQKGRPTAASVLTVPAEQAAIADAIRRAFALDCSGVENPYGQGGASVRIRDILKDLGADGLRRLVRKSFVDLEPAR